MRSDHLSKHFKTHSKPFLSPAKEKKVPVTETNDGKQYRED